jgi:outer membrane beta-barrel protein
MHFKGFIFAAIFACGAFWANSAEAGREAAQEALADNRLDRPTQKDVVQNRFFIKTNRFEIAPVLGMVPNNPMVNRITGGVLGAYHFSESLAAEGAFIYSPDLGAADLKGLTNTLVQIAHDGNADVDFQQPLDKMELGATFAVRWAPIYGKINLIGENVLNFDMYGVAGLGMLSSNVLYAKYDGSVPDGEAPVQLVAGGRKVRVPLNLGMGIDFFLSQSISLKIDARSYLYYALKPQYDPDVPETEFRIYNNFVASAGVSIFVPKMNPRVLDF